MANAFKLPVFNTIKRCPLQERGTIIVNLEKMDPVLRLYISFFFLALKSNNYIDHQITISDMDFLNEYKSLIPDYINTEGLIFLRKRLRKRSVDDADLALMKYGNFFRPDFTLSFPIRNHLPPQGLLALSTENGDTILDSDINLLIQTEMDGKLNTLTPARIPNGSDIRKIGSRGTEIVEELEREDPILNKSMLNLGKIDKANSVHVPEKLSINSPPKLFSQKIKDAVTRPSHEDNRKKFPKFQIEGQVQYQNLESKTPNTKNHWKALLFIKQKNGISLNQLERLWEYKLNQEKIKQILSDLITKGEILQSKGRYSVEASVPVKINGFVKSAKTPSSAYIKILSQSSGNTLSIIENFRYRLRNISNKEAKDWIKDLYFFTQTNFLSKAISYSILSSALANGALNLQTEISLENKQFVKKEEFTELVNEISYELGEEIQFSLNEASITE